MDYLQYFNINDVECEDGLQVLNLIINGLPSIHMDNFHQGIKKRLRFKPYYKWITFNTY